MDAISASTSSSSFALPASAAVVPSFQSKKSFRCHVLNSHTVSPCHNRRLRLRLAAPCNKGTRVARRGDNSRVMTVAFAERPSSTGGKNGSSSVVVVRAATVAAEDGTAATAGNSLEELKSKGDSYFVNDARPVILFDGVCNMCNGGVNFMLDNDAEGKIRFAALQSEAGRVLLVRSGRSSDDISSIVLVDKDRSYIKSEAILRIGQHLSFPYRPAAFFAVIFPLFFRDTLYDAVADNRYSVFGKTNSCRLSDPRFAERFIE